ncbi:MAG: hypothetical protein HMLKMBBP_03649 [Planctomycetes bacterium]|nr:hypothetical protein [Planctomycetota bacterium]
MRSHLPVGAAPDILRELESSILDRADAIAARDAASSGDEAVRRALSELGEPERVAGAYTSERHIVAPESYRAFVVTFALLVAVHLSLIGIASTMDRTLLAGPVEVSPVGTGGFADLASAAMHAVLLDLGITVLVYWSAPLVRGMARFVPASFRVDAAPRAAGSRAVLSLLVAVVLACFRDRLFVIADGEHAWPLATEWASGMMPLVISLLAGAVVTDLLYVVRGETRATVAIDAFHGAATLAAMVHLAGGEALLAVPAAATSLRDVREPVNGFLADLGTLIVCFVAMIAAVKTVRRLVRVAQI